MSRKFGDIHQSERLYTKEDIAEYILAEDALPPLDRSPVGLCRFLLKYQEIGGMEYAPGKIYIVRQINDEKVWMDIAISELGALPPPTGIWKRITNDSIILHWKDPADIVSDNMSTTATWSHDVIVRKRGTAPISPTDGEVVGYSSVRDQYAGDDALGFVHPVNSETDSDYYYRVFAITRSGIATGTESSMRSSWTWQEISEQISSSVGTTKDHYKRVFKVGDIFPMPEHRLYGILHAQVVALEYSTKFPGGETQPSITFMTMEILGGGDNGARGLSFNNKELDYAPTGDTYFKRNKDYFVKRDGVLDTTHPYTNYTPGDPIPTDTSSDGYLKKDIYENNPSIRYFKGDPATSRYKNIDAQLFMTAGRGHWNGSALQKWLQQYYKPGPTADMTLVRNMSFDVYNDKDQADTAFIPVHKESMTYEDITWTGGTIRNGWFTTNQGQYHRLAPCYDHSAKYIEIPLFCHGFTTDEGLFFLDHLMTVKSRCITDQYVDRTVRDDRNDTTVVRTAYYNDVPDSRFWLPSYEEIFGTRPVYGHNGTVSTSGMITVHEGMRFSIFDPAVNPNYREDRVRVDINGTPCAYWTRSVDPTSPGRVYYVDNKLPESDAAVLVNLSANAHRDLDDQRIGAAVCFTLVGS